MVLDENRYLFSRGFPCFAGRLYREPAPSRFLGTASGFGTAILLSRCSVLFNRLAELVITHRELRVLMEHGIKTEFFILDGTAATRQLHSKFHTGCANRKWPSIVKSNRILNINELFIILENDTILSLNSIRGVQMTTSLNYYSMKLNRVSSRKLNVHD